METIKTITEIEGRTWCRACSTDDVPDDEGYLLSTLPPVAVFTWEGEYFCLDDTCSHGNYPLSKGWVENCSVECSLHFAKFDLRTGKPLGPPASCPVATHPVEVINGDVFVALPNNYQAKG
ncbi:bifunctional 3-phenylpropionate/cinnamic acid dioxygenase ferredoxin subunit [Pseudomonas aeruginosa]|uniref:bifunctional 3-phenylpropionate/cinnamic acid dioxygenase ferredoxin subunit n=1 Tax=Pseudomonadaceae TaxID=135621 RepID=UPI001553ACE8|nr:MULTISPECIES: bifunctional 3-phenylpropionate/cinnamic acid dioxygenase ferredoxin subunit [Pseudomonas]QKF01646.1 bifunctional 3-phenylpropionate/cinnamic acid dioxygenase ferredoxin subunit [Pseudomonas aeruginosa]MCK2119960.1 bifunctional 3-phenylpropionate/cinnamic acid dioxygenase ferredoxin subunit [Pseudomonas sp. PNPG3]WAG81557.1 bifunctional 3-phenylpropionate/cinnamic acid dioxygenase ferredoxin subunit [Pseudomonas furukawaii]HCF1525203.1 bifunctional 3-phenylpropionate/cinnamic a